MKAHELARQIQSEPVPRDLATGISPMEPLEDVGLGFRRNTPAGVGDAKFYLPLAGAGADSDGPPRSIIFAGIIEQVLHHQGGKLLLPGNGEMRRDVAFDPQVGAFRHGMKIIHMQKYRSTIVASRSARMSS